MSGLVVYAFLSLAWLASDAIAENIRPLEVSTKFSQTQPEHFLSVFDIAQVPDGGYVLAGSVSDASTIGEWAWFAKVNRDGKREWEKEFGKTTLNSRLVKIDVLQEGSMVAVGATNDSPRGTGKAAQGWVVLLTGAGKMRWERHFGDGWRSIAYARAIKSLPTGDLVIVGDERQGGKTSVVMTKLNTRGQTISQVVSRSTELYAPGVDAGFSPGPIVILDDGAIVQGGRMFHMDKRVDAQLARIAPDGKELWERRFSGAEGRSVGAIRPVRDGKLLVGLEAGVSRPSGVSLALVDKAGELAWEKSISAREVCSISFLADTPSGGVIAGGATCDGERNRVWVGRFSAAGDLSALQTLIPWSGGSLGYVRPIVLESSLKAVLAVAAKSPAKEIWFFRRPIFFGQPTS
jgi:hypothetical protein